MKKYNILGILVAIATLETISVLSPALTLGANLTAVKNTLSSSRLSFAGRVAAPTAVGSSSVYINTSASTTRNSISTAGLKPGDVVKIGDNNYTIRAIVGPNQFTTTTVLASGDADVNDDILFLSRPQQVITFKTASAVPNGFFRVLIPANASTQNDSIPDPDGFDFASSPAPTAVDATGYTFVTALNAATVSGGTNCTAGYHCFEFHYNGTGGVGTDITLNIGAADGSTGLIAPAPKSGHATGSADVYTFRVQNFVNAATPTGTPTDATSGQIGVIESVRVSATVDPSITFRIEGVLSGASACGLTTSGQTNADSVPFGVLSLDTFKVLAQRLVVSTNAVSGYVVTASESGALSNFAASPSYIPDTTCDTGTCDHVTAAAWGTALGHAGFGYTMGASAGTPTLAPSSQTEYRHFPSIAQTPATIMSSASIASGHAAFVCYKIAVDATQPAGDYENQITYTATASF